MKKKIYLFVLLWVLASGALAGEGAYNLVGIGISPLQLSQWGFGVSLGGGYNFNQYVGLETQVSVLGIGTTNNVAVMPIPSLTINGYLPVNERTSLFGKIGKSASIVGYGGADTQAHYSGQANFFGVGVEISSTANKDTYRFGIDYYDLGATPGAPLSAYYLNLTSTTHF